MRAHRSLFIHVKRLWIEARGECFYFLSRENMTAEHKRVADAEFIEIVHCASACAGAACDAAGIRRPNIEVVRRLITATSAWLNISNRNFTSPISRRECEGLLSSTVARTRSRSPGRTGASHLTSSTPGDPMELESTTNPSAMMRISSEQLCQPDAASPPNIEERAASSSK